MGEVTDLMHAMDDKLREFYAARAQMFEHASVIRSITDDMAKIGSKMSGLLDALVTDSINETEGEGGPNKRQRKSTNLEGAGEDKKVAPVKKERAVREMSGELVEPGSGKRGCSLCKRTGHRAKNCPNT